MSLAAGGVAKTVVGTTLCLVVSTDSLTIPIVSPGTCSSMLVNGANLLLDCTRGTLSRAEVPSLTVRTIPLDAGVDLIRCDSTHPGMVDCNPRLAGCVLASSITSRLPHPSGGVVNAGTCGFRSASESAWTKGASLSLFMTLLRTLLGTSLVKSCWRPSSNSSSTDPERPGCTASPTRTPTMPHWCLITSPK